MIKGNHKLSSQSIVKLKIYLINSITAIWLYKQQGYTYHVHIIYNNIDNISVYLKLGIKINHNFNKIVRQSCLCNKKYVFQQE